MSSIAVHMRMTKLVVSDEDVNKAQAATTDLVQSWGKTSLITELLTRAADISEMLSGDGKPRPAIASEIEAVVQKHASAFLYAENPLMVGVVAGTAFLELVKPEPSGDWTTAEVLATALWSALSYLPTTDEPRRDTLRAEVLQAAEQRSVRAAENGRKRREVANFKDLLLAEPEEGKPSSNFLNATAATIDALRQNAALDREELDFLWWSQSERSLGRQRLSLAEPVRIVASGIEGAAFLRRLPCDVHRDIVLRTLDKDPELDLKKLLHAIGAERTALRPDCDPEHVAKWPTIFPLLSGLATGEAKGPGHSTKRKTSEWGCRALLEAGFARLLKNGNPPL